MRGKTTITHFDWVVFVIIVVLFYIVLNKILLYKQLTDTVYSLDLTRPIDRVFGSGLGRLFEISFG